MTMPLVIFLVAVIVSSISFITVVTFIEQRKKEREVFYRTELFKKLAESTGDQVQKVLDAMRERELAAERRRREGMKLGGLIVVAAGLGVTVFMRLMTPNEPMWAAGLIPMLIGGALVVYAYFLAPRTPAG